MTRRLAFPFVLALAVVDAAGYSLIAPVLPELASRTGSGPLAMSLVFSTFPAGMMVGFVLAGLALRKGRLRPVLVGSLLVCCVGSLGFVLGSELAVYVPSRTIMGLGSGGLWMSLIMLTLAWWRDDAYRRTSRVLAAYTAGGLVGPALGALGGVRAPFIGYFALLMIFLVATFAMKVPVTTTHRAGSSTSTWRISGFWLSAACIAFAVVAGGINEGVLPLHLSSELNQGTIGALFVGMAIVGSLSSVAAGAFTPRRLLPVCVPLIVGGIGLAASTSTVWLWLLALGLAAVGGGIAGTAAMGLLIEAVPADRLVTATVLWSQFSIIGYLLGPAIGGPVVAAFGYGALILVPLAAAIPLAALTIRQRPIPRLRQSNANHWRVTAGCAREPRRRPSSKPSKSRFEPPRGVWRLH